MDEIEGEREVDKERGWGFEERTIHSSTPLKVLSEKEKGRKSEREREWEGGVKYCSIASFGHSALSADCRRP